VARLVKVGEVAHVSGLQSGRRVFVELGCVWAEDEENDGEMIQLHAHVRLSV
jgi:hypothetical protein